MILEAIVTTENDDGSTNIAPMGPRIEQGFHEFILRPFATSQTCQNLLRIREGVMHVTDDVGLIAQFAVHGNSNELGDWYADLRPARTVRGMYLASACRTYEFRVLSIDDLQDRVTLHCEVVDQLQLREFWGFNRAKHAVIEAAIAATRIGILSDDEIRQEFSRAAIIVGKTGGEQEHSALQFLQSYWQEKRSC
jgi:uncharacterized protein